MTFGGGHSESAPTGTNRGLTIGMVLALCVYLFSPSGAAHAQQQSSPASSDLSRRNMGQVAASAEQIKVVLVQDPGLMVALKRWAAKDASEKGQIVTESDLSDDALFQRLQDDVRFRSVATELLQRYGYLVPRVNPNSELGQEQALLIQERAKWIAQEEEQRRMQGQQAQYNADRNRNCAEGQTESCQQSVAPNGALQPPQRPTVPPGGSNPSPGGSNKPVEHAGLTQTTDNQGDTDFPQNSSQDNLMVSPNREPQEGGLSPSPIGSGLQGLAPDQNIAGLDRPDSLDQTTVNPFAPTRADQTARAGASGYLNPASTASSGGTRQAMLEPVAMVRKANPYDDIPSLYDMYVQATPRPAELRRFGMDVFENNSQNPDWIPTDLPAGPEYVVGPGDGLAINLWGGVSRQIYQTVDREGRINLPEIGPQLVSGQSLAEVQQNLQRVLRTQFRDVSVDVSLARLRTIRVYVVGDVAKPGAYDISSLSTPLNALFAAGGPTPGGSLRIVRHFRDSQLVQNVDLYDLLLHGVKSDIQRLENGDTVMIPPIGPQLTVEGMVRRPAVYELKDEKNLASVLELAGGLLPTATLRHIEVQRTIAHDKQTMLSLDIPTADDNGEVTKNLESFQIQDGDRIRIFPIGLGNEDAVYLEGHVIRPGRYSYRNDMRVTDLISSFKELLPEPALQYAEIIRLNAPDFHPTVESFDLAAALANPSQAPVLQPMDTIRIFSRFDFENPPTVSVLGEVREPGTYRTSGQIHLADAVHLAGGLAPDAQTEDAQVFRFASDGKGQIFSVNLSRAFAGDSTENIVLNSRDRLLVHKSADAEQPPAIYIEGEVGSPGRYPLTANMTVADLIRVGGGLKPDADTQMADLTNYEWEGSPQLTANHQPIVISGALSGEPKENPPLHNGDVLTIRQLPDWNDLGARITIKGQVKHPGTYGIRPGERLSSVVERAGGFLPDSYPYGAILQRTQVRDLETVEQDKLILRVKDAEGSLEAMPDITPAQKQAKEMALGQYQTTLLQLSTNPPVGRIAIHISARLDRWKNTTSDIDVRAGDILFVPKRPDYVMVTGQVFNPTAVAFRPGRSAKWYLAQAGGPTTNANRKAIFVIRADGSVIGQREGMWSGSSLGTVLQPGDSIIVPEKTIGGGVQWATLFTAASVASSIVTAVFIATHY